jgi:tetratricopeptide (TPR) repeat protein
MRWLTVAGQGPQAQREQKAATDDFDLAWQFLQRDSVNYWEFLIRRAEHRFLEQRFQDAIDDVAITTQTNNLSVPAHMWHAHARAARRVVEIGLAKNDVRSALGWARKAVEVVKSGEAWKSAEFSQDQWLEGVRVLTLACEVEATQEALGSLRGLMGYYVREAAKDAPPAYEAAEVTRAKVLAAQAALALVEARFARVLKKEADAAKFLAESEKLARESIALREGVAKAGGLLPASFAWHVLADVLRLTGRAPDAAEADKQAWAAQARNPE